MDSIIGSYPTVFEEIDWCKVIRNDHSPCKKLQNETDFF